MTRLRDESDFDDWLFGLVVPGAPRGDEARSLALALVEVLGHPQRHVPAVHIVGTAGKGTVAALLTGRLAAAGVRVATHQSPHVHDVRERFLLDNRLPEWPQVIEAARAVEVGLETVRATRGRWPTFFAATAALSWELGRRAGVDVFVTEAGIGGRRDATSVLDRPDTLTVITDIGLDHTDVLGATVEEIAAEKAAVLAGRGRAVLGPQTTSVAVRVVREVAARHGVALTEVTSERGDRPGDWRDDAAATVDAVAELLGAQLGRELPGVSSTLPPGRYEVRQLDRRRVVLDGAHNPLKLAALGRVVARDPAPVVVIAALGAGKDLIGCASGLAALAGGEATVVTTEFGGPGPTSWPAADLADAISRAGGRAEPVGSIAAAADRARELTGPGDTILVTGSFMILARAAAALAR